MSKTFYWRIEMMCIFFERAFILFIVNIPHHKATCLVLIDMKKLSQVMFFIRCCLACNVNTGKFHDTIVNCDRTKLISCFRGTAVLTSTRVSVDLGC